jgi:hypothetical protein
VGGRGTEIERFYLVPVEGDELIDVLIEQVVLGCMAVDLPR